MSDNDKDADMADVAQADSNATRGGHVPLRWVALVLVVFAALVYLGGVTATPDNAGIAYQTIAAVALVAVFAAEIAFCVLVHQHYVGTPLLRWPGRRRILLEAAIAVAVAIVWALGVSLLAQLSPELKRLANPSGVVYEPVIIAPVVYCLSGFTVAPLAEEMLYRALLFGSLRRWMRPAFAVVLQALVFGLMHRYGLSYIAIAFASGLLLMALYLWRRTLWSPILAHSLFNAVSLIPLLVMLLATGGDTFLGISMADGAKHPGCTVASVFPDSPAEMAGLQVGDVITAIDQEPVFRAKNVTDIIKSHKRQDAVHIVLVRQEQVHELAVVLRARRPHILW